MAKGERHAVLAAVTIALVVLLPAEHAAPETPAVRAVILGIAQDGGVPHVGCARDVCAAAWRDPSRRERVASLGLVDETEGRIFLIDATPDLPSQLVTLSGRADRRPVVDGILLTHAHVGHYAGLMYLGREALGASGIPVHATPRMAGLLRENQPWSRLVALGQVSLREIEPGRPLVLTPRLRVVPLPVPHRDELSDTVGFRVEGPLRKLLYIPDVDRWERWERDLAREVADVDVALLDGTFEDAGELGDRRMEEVRHPLVGDTMRRLPTAPRGRVVFIHLNHTNRLLWDEAARWRLTARGFGVARDGEVIPL